MIPEPENMIDDLVNTVISPFTDLLHNWFWGIIFSVIAMAVYTKSGHPGPATAVMILSTVFCAAVLDSPIVYIYAILAALGFVAVIYKLYRGKE